VLLGRFCANCSQPQMSTSHHRELAHDLFEGLDALGLSPVAHADDVVFKPGKLTAEFIAGRRIAYLPPFRLYLILSIVFF